MSGCGSRLPQSVGVRTMCHSSVQKAFLRSRSAIVELEFQRTNRRQFLTRSNRQTEAQVAAMVALVLA